MRVPLSSSSRERRRGERGAVAVLVGVLMVPLVLVLGLVADFGMAYSQRQALSTGADAAALAVVNSKYEDELRNPTRTCAQILTADAALPAGSAGKASKVALDEINANAPYAVTLPSSAVTVDMQCVSSGKVLQVKVSVTRSIRRTFGLIAGSSPLTMNRSATAALGVRNKISNLKPIAICRYQAQTIVDDAALDRAAGHAYRAETIALSKVWSGASTCDGGGGSGNWGWLDLGQGNGASALADMIRSGSTTPLELTGTPPAYSMGGTPGNKGNSAGVRSAMSDVMDSTIVLPVYNSYDGNGSNATYSVSGFLTVKLCGFDSTIRGTCFDSSVPMGSNEMQVRFVSYTTEGDLGTVCGIGDPACAFDSYVSRMVG